MHLILVSRDGEFLNGGEFTPSLGFYATIRKANSGGPLDWTKYKYLDAMHMGVTGHSIMAGNIAC
jgi:hypothetical protein